MYDDDDEDNDFQVFPCPPISSLCCASAPLLLTHPVAVAQGEVEEEEEDDGEEESDESQEEQEEVRHEEGDTMDSGDAGAHGEGKDAACIPSVVEEVD